MLAHTSNVRFESPKIATKLQRFSPMDIRFDHIDICRRLCFYLFFKALNKKNLFVFI